MFIRYLICLFASAAAASAAVAVPASGDVGQDEAARAITVTGTVGFPSATFTDFAASFVVDNITHTFKGTNVLPLASLIKDAKLTFNNVSQLTGTQSFGGTEGPFVMKMDLDSGAMLSWNLFPPTTFPVPLSGSGTWS